MSTAYDYEMAFQSDAVGERYETGAGLGFVSSAGESVMAYILNSQL